MPNSSDTPDNLTIFYTCNLRGKLHKLPRLYTFLQRLKMQRDIKPLLLDTGNACADDIWHCDITGGRSTLVVLDGMGYHAANVEGYLQPEQRYQLQTAISTGMVDAEHNWRYHVPPVRDEGVVVAGQQTPALRLCIVAALSAETRLQDGTLYLQQIAPFDVGVVSLDLQDTPQLTEFQVEAMPSGVPPDATIAASVEFVEDEARFLRKKQRG
jgi:hypothetical protein